MYATISIKDIKVWCILGLTPDQRVNDQCITITVSALIDITRSALSDKPEDMEINTKLLAGIAKDVPVAGKFKLIESLSWQIISEIFNRSNSVVKANVTILKNNIYAPTEISLSLTREEFSKIKGLKSKI